MAIIDEYEQARVASSLPERAMAAGPRAAAQAAEARAVLPSRPRPSPLLERAMASGPRATAQAAEARAGLPGRPTAPRPSPLKTRAGGPGGRISGMTGEGGFIKQLGNRPGVSSPQQFGGVGAGLIGVDAARQLYSDPMIQQQMQGASESIQSLFPNQERQNTFLGNMATNAPVFGQEASRSMPILPALGKGFTDIYEGGKSVYDAGKKGVDYISGLVDKGNRAYADLLYGEGAPTLFDSLSNDNRETAIRPNALPNALPDAEPRKGNINFDFNDPNAIAELMGSKEYTNFSDSDKGFLFGQYQALRNAKGVDSKNQRRGNDKSRFSASQRVLSPIPDNHQLPYYEQIPWGGDHVEKVFDGFRQPEGRPGSAVNLKALTPYERAFYNKNGWYPRGEAMYTENPAIDSKGDVNELGSQRLGFNNAYRRYSPYINPDGSRDFVEIDDTFSNDNLGRLGAFAASLPPEQYYPLLAQTEGASSRPLSMGTPQRNEAPEFGLSDGVVFQKKGKGAQDYNKGLVNKSFKPAFKDSDVDEFAYDVNQVERQRLRTIPKKAWSDLEQKFSNASSEELRSQYIRQFSEASGVGPDAIKKMLYR